MLVAARVVQAIGTAIMMPLLMTTVMTLVPRAGAAGRWATSRSSSRSRPRSGQQSPGLVLTFSAGGSLFILVLPIALAALALGACAGSWTSASDADAPLDVSVRHPVGDRLRRIGVRPVRPRRETGGVARGDLDPIAVGGVGMVVFVLRQLRLQRDDRALLDLRTFRRGTSPPSR